MTVASENGTVYDVAVIGAGPAGAQAAISAAHQARHVLVLDAGPISHLKGARLLVEVGADRGCARF